MNIFRVHEDNQLCIHQTCDKHINVGVKELAQLLSDACRDMGYEKSYLYEPFNPKHPIVDWLQASWGNLRDTFELAVLMDEEYQYRNDNGHHLSHKKVLYYFHPEDFYDGYDEYETTTQPPCGECGPVGSMCDECLVEGDVVESYRRNYINEKNWNLTWTGRDIPEWYVQKQVGI